MNEVLYHGHSVNDVRKWAEKHIGLEQIFFDRVLSLRQDFCLSVTCMVVTKKDFWDVLPERTYTIQLSKWEGWKIMGMIQ